MSIINSKINLVHYKNFLSQDECTDMMKNNQDGISFKRTRSIQHGVTNKITSKSKRLLFAEDLNYRIWRTGLKQMMTCGIIPRSSYPLVMLKYDKHEYTTKHLDCLTPQELAIHQSYNQHLFTFILYLNDDYCGGELEFDKLNLTIKPSAGDAYMWKNVLDTRKDEVFIPDVLSSHRSRPIRKGTKLNVVKFFT